MLFHLGSWEYALDSGGLEVCTSILDSRGIMRLRAVVEVAVG